MFKSTFYWVVNCLTQYNKLCDYIRIMCCFDKNGILYFY